MRCPQCGKWNRDTYPRCFTCGAVLPVQNEQALEQWEAENRGSLKPASTTIYSVQQDNTSTRPSPDDRDSLAGEMQDLRDRRVLGMARKERFIRDAATSEQAAGGSSVYTTRTFTVKNDSYDAPREENARSGYSVYNDVPAGDGWSSGSYDRRAENRRTTRRSHSPAVPGLRRFFPLLSILLILSAAGLGGYAFINHRRNIEPPLTFEQQVEIIPSMYNDMAAHTIRIPAEEGARIYIRELHGSSSYVAVADETGKAYAEVTIADYTWYELEKNITSDTMEITLTPYERSASGELKLLGTVHYTIDIPLSPCTLVSPDTTYLEVTSSPYALQFRVEQNSTVFINGEDFSSFVNTQDGLITYNAPVQAIGENTFEIVVNCQAYRENRLVVTLYRAPQDIPLELGATLGNTSSNTQMTITGTTVPGATITVLSPHVDLDTSNLNSTGAFSFKAVFSTIGTNDITIVAEKDGHTATLIKSIYYVPYASTYTPKAWAMDSSAAGISNYADYLNNTAVRVANTQIYVCIGTITEILSNKPQLALMDTDDTEQGERLVLLENMSGDTWVVGQRYRVYADAFGIYDGKPRLIGRYTYAPLK